MRRTLALVAAGVVVAGVAGAVLAAHLLRPQSPVAAFHPPPATIITDTPPIPMPSPSGLEAVVPGERIEIPDLHIDLPLVMGDGLTVPMYKAAVYPTLGIPGSGTRSMVYAHAQPGMFGPLWNARVGERVYVDVPGTPRLAYVIREFYPRWPVTDPKWLAPLGQDQLVLVTCTTWNPDDPRVIAVAVPTT